jgi:hypothetical protein
MSADDSSKGRETPFKTRLVRVLISVVVLTGVTVVLGYGGWAILTLTAHVSGYEPETAEGDLLRNRLLDWPERNREVMRSNGRKPLPVKP